MSSVVEYGLGRIEQPAGASSKVGNAKRVQVKGRVRGARTACTSTERGSGGGSRGAARGGPGPDPPSPRRRPASARASCRSRSGATPPPRRTPPSPASPAPTSPAPRLQSGRGGTSPLRALRSRAGRRGNTAAVSQKGRVTRGKSGWWERRRDESRNGSRPKVAPREVREKRSAWRAPPRSLRSGRNAERGLSLRQHS